MALPCVLVAMYPSTAPKQLQSLRVSIHIVSARLILDLLEQRWWTTDNILLCQQHSITNALAIVEHRAMRQARRFTANLRRQ
jgi:hypothetical protein